MFGSATDLVAGGGNKVVGERRERGGPEGPRFVGNLRISQPAPEPGIEAPSCREEVIQLGRLLYAVSHLEGHE